MESGIPLPRWVRGDREGRIEESGQLFFLCTCGEKAIELKTSGCRRSCYDRQYRSQRLFGGLRERVLKRDKGVCAVNDRISPTVSDNPWKQVMARTSAMGNKPLLEAKTIHRLLEADPGKGGFKRCETDPLACDLLVVDDVSMVDVPLMASLIRRRRAIRDFCW